MSDRFSGQFIDTPNGTVRVMSGDADDVSPDAVSVIFGVDKVADIPTTAEGLAEMTSWKLGRAARVVAELRDAGVIDWDEDADPPTAMFDLFAESVAEMQTITEDEKADVIASFEISPVPAGD